MVKSVKIKIIPNMMLSLFTELPKCDIIRHDTKQLRCSCYNYAGVCAGVK